MGREVRRVPKGWVHPRSQKGFSVPLYDGCTLESSTERWDEDNAKWQRGELPEYATEKDLATPFDEWDGPRPDPVDYMPAWTEEEATHYQMYETCSEGSPISPVFADPEELAEWLAANHASTFANCTASRDDWMRIILGADAFLMWSPGKGGGVVIC